MILLTCRRDKVVRTISRAQKRTTSLFWRAIFLKATIKLYIFFWHNSPVSPLCLNYFDWQYLFVILQTGDLLWWMSWKKVTNDTKWRIWPILLFIIFLLLSVFVFTFACFLIGSALVNNPADRWQLIDVGNLFSSSAMRTWRAATSICHSTCHFKRNLLKDNVKFDF